MLCVIETHPVQYHAPVYQAIAHDFQLPIVAVYGTDCSIAGYNDSELDTYVAWDTDLVSGYSQVFLSTVAGGAAKTPEEASTHGLGKALRELRPTAILLTGYSPRFYELAFVAAARVGCPLLFRGETTDHAHSRSRSKQWLRDAVLRWFYSRCAGLLYIGQHSRRHFLRLGCPPDKLQFSPYCVDTTAFQTDEAARDGLRRAARRELNIPETCTVLVFSGKLSRRKGVDLLLAAAKSLPAIARDRIVILYVGAGELAAALREAASSEPTVEIRMAGFQNQSQISRFYHAADFLVLPSIRSETWGLVVNDALHHGLPCIVSDAVGCAPDLIVPGKTGEVCLAGSVASLREAIERGLGWKHDGAVRARCRSQVAKYTVQEAAKGIVGSYNDVAADLRAH